MLQRPLSRVERDIAGAAALQVITIACQAFSPVHEIAVFVPSFLELTVAHPPSRGCTHVLACTSKDAITMIITTIEPLQANMHLSLVTRNGLGREAAIAPAGMQLQLPRLRMSVTIKPVHGRSWEGRSHPCALCPDCGPLTVIKSDTVPHTWASHTSRASCRGAYRLRSGGRPHEQESYILLCLR